MEISDERAKLIAAIANGEWEGVDAQVLEACFNDEEEFEKLTTQHEKEFLETATAEELHYCAELWNWDGGVDFLRRILHHPNCDLGTALLMYWLGGAAFYARYNERSEVSKYQLENYDFLMEIEQLVLEGKIQSAQIRFDPSDDKGESWLPSSPHYGTVRREIPKEMYGPWCLKR